MVLGTFFSACCIIFISILKYFHEDTTKMINTILKLENETARMAEKEKDIEYVEQASVCVILCHLD